MWTLDAVPSGVLVYRLIGPDWDRGRRVKCPSAPWYYLAVVPDSWQRDELRAGKPPVMPEYVAIESVDGEIVPLDGYMAHYFDTADGSSIAFYDDQGRSVIIS